MAFIPANLFRLPDSPAQSKHWQYQTTDSFATVCGPSYFTDGYNQGLQVSDQVTVITYNSVLPDGTFSGFSTSNAANVTTVVSYGAATITAYLSGDLTANSTATSGFSANDILISDGTKLQKRALINTSTITQDLSTPGQLKLNVQNLLRQYSSYAAFGDSITVGYNATTTTSYGYVYRMSADLGGIPVNNYGSIGASSATMADAEVFANANPTDELNQLYTILIGTNDANHATGAYEDVYKLCLEASASWLAISRRYKVFSQDSSVTAGGSWAADTTYQTGIGKNSTTNGSTLSFPITTYGGPIYIWYRVINSNGGTFTAKVDGGSATTISCTTSPTDVFFTAHGYSVGVARITGVAAGSHTVLLTITSSTSASNIVGVLGVGTVPDATMAFYGAPSVYVGGVIRQASDANAAATAAYNADAQDSVNLLSGDGLNVYFVDVRKYISGSATDMDDIVHPTNAGHAKLRDAFEAAINPTSIPVRTNPELLNTGAGIAALNATVSGNYNTAYGWSALKSVTSGQNNAAIGSRTLESNTSGGSNTALGHYVLKANTTGDGNTGVGASALGNITTGSYNVGVGYGAIGAASTGTGNTGIGYSALNSVSTGSYSTAFGYQAGQNITSGNSNTAIGTNALLSCSTGQTNTAIGTTSLRNVTGDSNVGIGYYAGASITSGNNNTILSGAVGGTVTTGSNNTIIGNVADTNSASASYRTALGAGAIGAVDNAIQLGRSGTDDVYCGKSLHVFPAASLTPATNGELVFEATSNTTLTVRFKGSDGVVRSAALTLS